jgi:peroxiredoxin
MKNRLSAKTLTIITVGLVILIFPLLTRAFNPFSFKTDTPSSKKDRLFRKMGVLPFPHTTEAIDFTLKDLNGNLVRISDFRGNIVLLNFWTTWCPECRIEMPSMQKLYSRFKDNHFILVSVSIKETAAEVKSFFKKNELTFIGLLDSDGKASSQMAIRAIPTTFILSRNGKVLGTIMGAREWNGKESIALFDHLINLKEDPSS